MYSRNQQLLNKSPANFVHQLQSGHPHFLSASVAQKFSFRCSKSANITNQTRAAVLSGRGFWRFLGLDFVEDHCLFWPGSLLRFLNSSRKSFSSFYGRYFRFTFKTLFRKNCFEHVPVITPTDHYFFSCFINESVIFQLTIFFSKLRVFWVVSHTQPGASILIVRVKRR